MKRLLLLFILFSIYLTACNDKDFAIEDKTYQERVMVLRGLDNNSEQKDTLGLLTIKIPINLDTFYQWWNTSDCVSCGWMQYRFGNRHYQKITETGFFWPDKPDSAYHITIRHKPKKWTTNNTDTLSPLLLRDSSVYFNHWITNELFCKKTEYKKKSFLKVFDRDFFIVHFVSPCGYITDSPSLFVTAITNLKNRQLEIIAEYSGKDTAGFFELMHKSILSIRIKENP